MYHQKEQGAVLIMSLVFLIILTLSGLSSINYTNVNTRITANVEDQYVAFQSAESILAAGEEEALAINDKATKEAEDAAKDAGLTGVFAQSTINNAVKNAVADEVTNKPYIYPSGSAYDTLVTNNNGLHFLGIDLNDPATASQVKQTPDDCENNFSVSCTGFYIIAYDSLTSTYTITAKATGQTAGTQIILQSSMGLIP